MPALSTLRQGFIGFSYGLVALLELLAILCTVAVWMVMDQRLAFLAVDLLVAAMIIGEGLKWFCRRRTAWFDAYVQVLEARPLPSMTWRLTRARLRGLQVQ